MRRVSYDPTVLLLTTKLSQGCSSNTNEADINHLLNLDFFPGIIPCIEIFHAAGSCAAI